MGFLVWKYLGVLLSATIGLASTWFFRFTIDDPKRFNRKKLTAAGRIGLPLTCLAVIAVIATTVWTEMDSIDKRQAALKAQQEADQRSTHLQTKLDDIELHIAALTRDPDVLAAAHDKPALRRLLINVSEQIGGRSATVARLRELHPTETFAPRSIAQITTFGMRYLTSKRMKKIGSRIGSVLYGLESDLVLLQEIRDELVLKELVRYLPGYDYIWSGPPSRREVHGTGILYDTGTVRIDRPPARLSGDYRRRPLWLQVTIVSDCGSLSFCILNFHNAWVDHEDETRAELDALHSWIAGESARAKRIAGGIFYFDLIRYDRSTFGNVGAFFPSDDLGPDVSTALRPEGLKARIYSEFIVSEALRANYVPNSVVVEDLANLFKDLTVEQIVKEVTDNNPMSITLRLDGVPRG